MQYRTDKYGNALSVLGFGCMRFPTKGGRIDLAETEREILTAIRGGVNYFDTAYIYPGSEAALGEILERNQIRDHSNRKCHTYGPYNTIPRPDPQYPRI